MLIYLWYLQIFLKEKSLKNSPIDFNRSENTDIVILFQNWGWFLRVNRRGREFNRVGEGGGGTPVSFGETKGIFVLSNVMVGEYPCLAPSRRSNSEFREVWRHQLSPFYRMGGPNIIRTQSDIWFSFALNNLNIIMVNVHKANKKRRPRTGTPKIFIWTSKAFKMYGLTCFGGNYEQKTHTGKITTAVSLVQVRIMNARSHFMMSDDYLFFCNFLLFMILHGCVLKRTLLLRNHSKT